MADGEIDLYADDLEHEFNQENEFNNSEQVDLYDDVITASDNKRTNEEEFNGSENSHTSDHHHSSSNQGGMTERIAPIDASSTGLGTIHPGGPSKKIGLYVGNLTWWTSDIDIVEAINGINIVDILEVKFFENRANGQSKGFCVVTLGSENSVRNVIEKLPKTEIHGQNPVVTPCNKQNLNHFEMQSRKMSPSAGGNQQMGTGNRNFGGPNNMRPPLISRNPTRPQGPLIGSQPRMSMGPTGPQFGQNQPWNQSGGLGGRNGPQYNQNSSSRGPLMRMPNSSRIGGPQPLLRAPGPPGDPRAANPHQIEQWTDHGGHGGQQPPPPITMVPTAQANPALQQRPPGNVGMSQMGVPHGGPAPHVNPAFFQAPHQGIQGGDPYRSGVPPGPNQYIVQDQYGRQMGSGDGPLMPPLSEPEFQEIMSKNRNVSSSAIERAVSDASAGDYGSAIETLVTAISLIKQSKVAGDERCRIVISSLQDTLHGIEAKSYGSRKDRPRSRDRERSRERSRRKERRERSRSRERDYRDRSRERYHDDRYHERDYRDKDRDRDRDREHRSRH